MTPLAIQDLAVALVEGMIQPAQLPPPARKLVGDASTRFEAAHRLFAKVPKPLKSADHHPEAIDGARGAAAYLSGDLEAARRIYSAYPDPLSPVTAYRLHDVLFNLGASETDEQAEALAQWVLKIQPTSVRALKIRAVMAITAGRPRDAVVLLEKALALQLDYASGWYNLACAASMLGEKQRMLDALSKAIETARTTTLMDYREEAREDVDFERWRDDPDFRRLAIPFSETPGSETLVESHSRGDFDGVLTEAATLMGAHPAHAAEIATLARKASRAAMGDLDEHGEAHAFLYDLGDADTYRALDEALQVIASGGGADAVKRYEDLLESAGAPVAPRRPKGKRKASSSSSRTPRRAPAKKATAAKKSAPSPRRAPAKKSSAVKRGRSAPAQRPRRKK